MKAGSITGMEHITNELLTIQDSRLTLQQDETFYGELTLIDTYLDCNGYRLHTGGVLSQNDSIVNLDRGALHVDKDYDIKGNSILQMIRYEDRVYVGGTFSMASSLNHSSMLRAGRMEIMGDLDQSGDPNSFTSSELFTVAFLGSGPHMVHFMEEKDKDEYFANVDPDFDDITYTNASISVMTTAIYIGIGMAKGLAEAYLNPETAVIVGIFLAFYGISAVVMPIDTLMKAAEFVALVLMVLSVYSMLKAGDELGDALNGDYSERERAEQFGRAAVLMILGVVGLYGSMNAVLQPKMLRSILEKSKKVIGEKFSQIKSLVKIFTIRDEDSMLLYCEEYLSGPALQTLKASIQKYDIKQLHDLAKVIRETKKALGRILKEDELFSALENWQRSGGIKEAVQAVVDWIKLKQIAANRKNLKYKEVNVHGKRNIELDSVDLVNQVIFEDKSAKNLYMDNPARPQTEVQWAEKQIFRKGSKRIKAISQEEYTLSIEVSDDLPDIDQLKSIRKFVFVIEEDTYALRQAVEYSLTML